MADRNSEALDFAAACGPTAETVLQLQSVDFYTSHEQRRCCPMRGATREDSVQGGWYDTSAHMLWIGDRTRQPDHAHVEFMRGIENPIGLAWPDRRRRQPAAPDRDPRSAERGGAPDHRPLRLGEDRLPSA